MRKLIFGLALAMPLQPAFAATDEDAEGISPKLRACIETAARTPLNPRWDRTKELEVFFGISDPSKRPDLHSLLDDMFVSLMSVANVSWRFSDDIDASDFWITFFVDGRTSLSAGSEVLVDAYTDGDEAEAALLRENILNLDRAFLIRTRWNSLYSFKVVGGKVVDQPDQEQERRLAVIKVAKSQRLQYAGLAGAVMAALAGPLAVVELAACPEYDGVLNGPRPSLSDADILFLRSN